MSSTVTFYFSFSTTTVSNVSEKVSLTTQLCPTDIETECRKKNKYTNWNIAGATCFYREKCSGSLTCCSGGCGGGCNGTCKQKSYTGTTCKGYAGEGRCGCTAGGQQITKNCTYTCYSPPTTTYYPGATSVAYVSGDFDTKGEKYYIFKATYNTSLFTTLQQLIDLEKTINDNSDGLTAAYISSNTTQLNTLKKKLCTSSNLAKTPCTEYCKVNQVSGQLPTSNCPDAWNSLCKTGDNMNTVACNTWCSPTSNNETNCKDLYLAYCNNPSKFYNTVCRDFYKSQYISNQLSDPVTSILTSNCSKFADSNGNVIDSTGAAVVPGTTTTDQYPSTTCACFLPNSVYTNFYNSITKSYPEFKNYMTNNQCSYPDCANVAAIQPQKMTCPDVAITSCIINNTVGGSVTNSNFNIVNNCATEIEKTGSYTDKGLNVAPPEEKKLSSTVDVPPEESPPPTSTAVFSWNKKNNNSIVSFHNLVYWDGW